MHNEDIFQFLMIFLSFLLLPEPILSGTIPGIATFISSIPDGILELSLAFECCDSMHGCLYDLPAIPACNSTIPCLPQTRAAKL